MQTKHLFPFFLAAVFFAGCAKDDLPPSLTLNGDAQMTVYKGDAFSDPGAEAIDDRDGNITPKIAVSGTVGTAVGIYTLTYTVTDQAGNMATADRRVTVKYRNTMLAGTYSVTETSPFGTVNYTGSVTSGSSDNTSLVFGSLTAPDPIVVDADIDGLDDIVIGTVAQGGPVSNFQGTITEQPAVTFTMSYLRPIGNTTTNCTATWVKQ